SHYPSQGINPREALTMSYYTGPNELGIMPFRLRLMTNLDTFDDVEMQQFASWDLRSLIARKQAAAIAEVYMGASPAGRRFIEQKVADIDPSLVEALRSEAQ